MTVADTPAFEAPVTVADGVTTYTYNFDAYDPSHVQVQHTEADGTINFLTYDTDYSVAPVDAPGIGGTVTITLALTAGDEVVLFRDTSLAQSTSLPNQGPFFAETVEREFDRVAMLAQESARDVSLAVRFPIGATANAQFPVPVEGKSIVGRMVNGELVYKADGLSDADLTTAMDAAVGDATAAAAASAASASDNADQTALDRVATAADVVQTNADVAQTTIDKAATAADVAQTNADVVQTAADVLATVNAAADVALAAVPVGQVTIQNGAVDAGYLRFGEGGSFDRATYPDFATWWDANGDKWGMSPSEIAAGDLPDFQGRVLRTIGGLGPLVGAEQEDEVGPHKHYYTMDDGLSPAGSQDDDAIQPGWTGIANVTNDTALSDMGTGIGAETRVKSIGVRYQIKAYGALVNSGTADLVALEAAQTFMVRHDVQTLSDAQALQARTNLKLPASAATGTGLVLLASGTLSSAIVLDIPLTDYTAYRGIVVEIIDALPVDNNVGLYVQTSSDGGATFAGSGSDYSYGNYKTDTGSGGHTGSSSASSIQLCALASNASEGGVSGALKIMGQTNTATTQRVTGLFTANEATDNPRTYFGGGIRKSVGDVNALRFFFSSGNILSGEYLVHGYV